MTAYVVIVASALSYSPLFAAGVISCFRDVDICAYLTHCSGFPSVYSVIFVALASPGQPEHVCMPGGDLNAGIYVLYMVGMLAAII